MHTGQLFFPDALTDAVYKRSPYRRRAEPRPAQRRRLDLQERRQRSLVTVQKNGAGYIGKITMGVHRT